MSSRLVYCSSSSTSVSNSCMPWSFSLITRSILSIILSRTLTSTFTCFGHSLYPWYQQPCSLAKSWLNEDTRRIRALCKNLVRWVNFCLLICCHAEAVHDFQLVNCSFAPHGNEVEWNKGRYCGERIGIYTHSRSGVLRCIRKTYFAMILNNWSIFWDGSSTILGPWSMKFWEQFGEKSEHRYRSARPLSAKKWPLIAWELGENVPYKSCRFHRLTHRHRNKVPVILFEEQRRTDAAVISQIKETSATARQRNMYRWRLQKHFETLRPSLCTLKILLITIVRIEV